MPVAWPSGIPLQADPYSSSITDSTGICHCGRVPAPQGAPYTPGAGICRAARQPAGPKAKFIPKAKQAAPASKFGAKGNGKGGDDDDMGSDGKGSDDMGYDDQGSDGKGDDKDASDSRGSKRKWV